MSNNNYKNAMLDYMIKNKSFFYTDKATGKVYSATDILNQIKNKHFTDNQAVAFIRKQRQRAFLKAFKQKAKNQNA